MLQGDQCDRQMGLGDGAIEDDVGSGLCQYLPRSVPTTAPIPAILGGGERQQSGRYQTKPLMVRPGMAGTASNARHG